MSKFQVGDKVWSPVFGWGLVESISKVNHPMPVKVVFKNSSTVVESFNHEGKYLSNSPAPILFHDEVKDWPDPPKSIDWNKVAVDTPVFVRNSDDDPWEAGHFAVFQNGYYYCFNDGKTSFTTQDITNWSRCVLAE